MKKYYSVGLMLLAACCALSCEKYIEFDGEESAPRLTVSALAQAGEPLSAYVSASVFFLNNWGVESFVESLDVSRGRVSVSVNGAVEAMTLLSGTEQLDGSLLYGCDYVPQPGDHLVLEAEFPGFDPVRAETDVPFPPRFEVTSLAFREEGVVGELELSLLLHDDGSYTKYYCLVPKTEYHYGEDSQSYEVAHRFRSDDLVFKNMSLGVLDLYNVLFDDNSLVSHYFSDEMIRGKEHALKIVIPNLPLLEEGQRFFVELQTVTESLYWYDVSFAQMKNDFALFSEGVTLYSNVQDGYGVFCAAATTCVEVHF